MLRGPEGAGSGAGSSSGAGGRLPAPGLAGGKRGRGERYFLHRGQGRPLADPERFLDPIHATDDLFPFLDQDPAAFQEAVEQLTHRRGHLSNRRGRKQRNYPGGEGRWKRERARWIARQEGLANPSMISQRRCCAGSLLLAGGACIRHQSQGPRWRSAMAQEPLEAGLFRTAFAGSAASLSGRSRDPAWPCAGRERRVAPVPATGVLEASAA